MLSTSILPRRTGRGKNYTDLKTFTQPWLQNSVFFFFHPTCSLSANLIFYAWGSPPYHVYLLSSPPARAILRMTAFFTPTSHHLSCQLTSSHGGRRGVSEQMELIREVGLSVIHISLVGYCQLLLAD
jgi:hypothetical protein